MVVVIETPMLAPFIVITEYPLKSKEIASKHLLSLLGTFISSYFEVKLFVIVELLRRLFVFLVFAKNFIHELNFFLLCLLSKFKLNKHFLWKPLFSIRILFRFLLNLSQFFEIDLRYIIIFNISRMKLKFFLRLFKSRNFYFIKTEIHFLQCLLNFMFSFVLFRLMFLLELFKFSRVNSWDIHSSKFLFLNLFFLEKGNNLWSFVV